MSNRTSIYKFLYSQFGDIWYPGYDYENMVSVERQLSGVNSIVGVLWAMNFGDVSGNFVKGAFFFGGIVAANDGGDIFSAVLC